ncbi:MAG: glycoside hydrolase 100 family protein [Saprospiraceae bacterium]
MKKDELTQKAIEVLHRATTPDGILALAEDNENYRRVWSRDASIAGIAGLLAGDEIITNGLHSSLFTLANAQAVTGAIPSNVMPDSGKASYGSLAGRVDATTWWLIATAIYARHSQDQQFLKKMIPHVHKAFDVLRAWEFNERHLLYTPLSGNWADEYPLHGYLLYDNCLRLWALRAWALLLDSAELNEKSVAVSTVITQNFWPAKEVENLYHPKLQTLNALEFWIAGFHPGGSYDGIFDAAGNAFAILLGLGDQQKNKQIYHYLVKAQATMGRYLIPAFWPVIKPGDHLWEDVVNNYAYHFKNEPHHFHNGGSWPVMAAWLMLALQINEPDIDLSKWRETCMAYLGVETFPFPEYIDTLNGEAGGKKNLSFSAAACLLLSLDDDPQIKEKLCLI